MDKNFSKGLSRSVASGEYDHLFEWDKYMVSIPEIQFPAEWRIQIIPPFAGAIIRFRALYKNKSISVYLDGFNQLGIWYDENKKAAPYWEAYPINDDTFRCDMCEVSDLINAMKEEFEKDNDGKK